ncbi:unnamed protein product [Larinioides sclopetarius]|uniref:Elongation of very long chain fatty acids protein n=1 Tax=Larinioides sclopetarius TaxID=280406 RepID=A0AAV2A1Y8_9ARAC
MLMNSLSYFLFRDIENKLLFKNDYLLPSITIGYILFATWIGPSIMETRKHFALRKVMMVYNFFEVGVNVFLLQWIISTMLQYRYVHCMPHDDPRYLSSYKKTLPLWWCILLNKMFELLDTVFFVLRKKWNQLSGLHVMHHSVICILIWWGMRNPHKTGFYCLILLGNNIAVHSVMYTYYGLSGLGPHMAKYLWWKKYLTVLQMGQFVFNIAYVFIEFITGCEKAGTADIFILAFIAFLLVLFLNFYRRKYSS